MHGYGQFCPVAVACEVFAERWTPLILRELLAGRRRVSDVRRRLAVDRLPDRRIVVRFDFRGVPAGRGPATSWLVASRQEIDVCLKDPGYGIDLVVAADLRAFTRVWLGDVSFDEAVRSRGVRLEGPRDLVRAFPGWLLLSHFAGVARSRPARAS